MRPSSPSHSQSGQIAVVVLLIMVILLVMGLSLATRTTQESFFSQQTAETARVWNAAESGAEDALSQLAADPNIGAGPIAVESIINDSDVTATVATTNSYTASVPELATVTFNLEKTTPGDRIGWLMIKWASEENCADRAALLASVYYVDGGVTKVEHYPIGRGCQSSTDGFITPAPDSEPSFIADQPGEYKNYFGWTDIYGGIQKDVKFIRIKPLYADTSISISASRASIQGHIVTSTATNTLGNAVGTETRKVQATRSLPAAPGILDFALYSGGSIIKQ
jgi:Tfp pilus assembly protein PilX